MNKNTQSLLRRDEAVIWHPFTPLMANNSPLVVTSGKGAYLFTEDGRAILDAVSSWWVNLHGHANSHITKAVAKQAAELEHVIFAGFTHEPAMNWRRACWRSYLITKKNLLFGQWKYRRRGCP